ncbi:hypothetical protein [Streptomyces sp. Ncost-T10-10d]|uniref:hypothetical protein n=1 Tax=Streptomyces sp. Ncost-T10-10d TaxID=1839774 RepID=UPI00081F2496|nr:hypothetical protein [Streptomyces sp. Ncost-T10-10d]SCF56750.1 hypothetical protein GA0115254_101718 [Streptomyces sp. Ncost-T10-10d]
MLGGGAGVVETPGERGGAMAGEPAVLVRGEDAVGGRQAALRGELLGAPVLQPPWRKRTTEVGRLSAGAQTGRGGSVPPGEA